MILNLIKLTIKKFTFTMALFMGLLFSLTSINVAVAAENPVQNIAVVIIGSPDFKDKSTMKFIKKYFVDENKNKNLTFLYGDEVQSKYHDYWFDTKGSVDEGVPTKEDFLAFVSYSGYDKVIFLKVEAVFHNEGTLITPGPYGVGVPLTYKKITINGFLVDKDKVVKTASTTQDKFYKCFKEMGKVFNPLL